MNPIAKKFARVAVVGFVLLILIWLGLTVLTGVKLHRLGQDGAISVDLFGFPLARGERVQGNRRAAVEWGGYVIGLAPLALLFALSISRLRRTDRGLS